MSPQSHPACRLQIVFIKWSLQQANPTPAWLSALSLCWVHTVGTHTLHVCWTRVGYMGAASVLLQWFQALGFPVDVPWSLLLWLGGVCILTYKAILFSFHDCVAGI